MTLLLDDQSNDAGTHALLVGVGDYPFLKDGSAAAALRFAEHMGMGQLSSPPISVVEFARWLKDDVAGMNNPGRPLRSLQVLCSGPADIDLALPGLAPTRIGRASTGTVQTAIREWKLRASRNPENMSIFYFCGHGVSYSETENALLLDDFGSNQVDPMSNAIAFDAMKYGLMQHCEARYQYYFIDACRTLPSDRFLDLFGEDSTGIAVIAGRISREIRNKVAPVYFAAGLASAAYGMPGKASLFTQGLLDCFRGSGSREANNGWEVVASAIAEGVNKCVESLAFQKQPQYCQSREAGQPLTLHRLRGEPEAVVKIYTSDENHLPEAILLCESLPAPAAITRSRDEPFDVPWWIHLPRGTYAFSATLRGNPLPLGRRERQVAPPGVEVVI